MSSSFYILLLILLALLQPMSVSIYGQQGQIQVESEGDLEATLNGESFTTGNTITISGTVEDRAVDSFVNIDVIDPGSTIVLQASPTITADDTFTYSFEAGSEEGFDILEPMMRSGNYRVVVSYYENSGDFDVYEVEFVFEYAASTAVPPSVPGSEVEEGQPRTGGAGGAAIGITPQNGSVSRSSPLPPIFQSDIHGIRVAIPDSWVVDDRFNGTDIVAQQAVRQQGGEYVVAMCPQGQALPSIAGLYSCQFQSTTGTGRGMVIYSFDNLQTRPEFSSLTRDNRSVTTEDLMGLYFDLNRGLEIAISPHVEIVTNTDTAVNVVDSPTNQTIASIPGKYVEFIQSYPGVSYREFVLLALNNDTNTGYALRPVIEEGLESNADAPAFVRQIFGSFELVASPTTPLGATTTPPTLPTLSQPLQQQQQQQMSPSPFSQQLELQQELQSP